MAKTPRDRVKTLLARLDSMRSSQERGSEVSTKPKALFHKFVEQVNKSSKTSLSHWNGNHFTLMTCHCWWTFVKRSGKYRFNTTPGPDLAYSLGIKNKPFYFRVVKLISILTHPKSQIQNLKSQIENLISLFTSRAAHIVVAWLNVGKFVNAAVAEVDVDERQL